MRLWFGAWWRDLSGWVIEPIYNTHANARERPDGRILTVCVCVCVFIYAATHGNKQRCILELHTHDGLLCVRAARALRPNWVECVLVRCVFKNTVL